MTHAIPPALHDTPHDPALTERHVRILDAAEIVFARSGFDRATMNEVAAEAGMSPGNLYRYFASKDAIVEAITERDRTEITRDFASLSMASGPLLDQLERIGRRHLVEKPHHKAVLAMQIWAEAARNPALATLCASIEAMVLGGLSTAIAQAREAGELPADLDEEAFLLALSMMSDGFMTRRAADPHFDLATMTTTLFTSMRGLAQVLRKPPAGQVTP